MGLFFMGFPNELKPHLENPVEYLQLEQTSKY